MGSAATDGDVCRVGCTTHKGKAGKLHDSNTNKTGHTTITAKQNNGERFRAPAGNVGVQTSSEA